MFLLWQKVILAACFSQTWWVLRSRAGERRRSQSGGCWSGAGVAWVRVEGAAFWLLWSSAAPGNQKIRRKKWKVHHYSQAQWKRSRERETKAGIQRQKWGKGIFYSTLKGVNGSIICKSWEGMISMYPLQLFNAMVGVLLKDFQSNHPKCESHLDNSQNSRKQINKHLRIDIFNIENRLLKGVTDM